ncbi:MAG: helix-turn-helix domain-containing protein, partial [Candidatus Eremiobacteraeota bacterium]|nr:helix-turn-helix domain-containing protein [Candidatus Eremiobacteraeota bacterium]
MERDLTDRAFGDLLREYRSAAGLSQEALAERARLSPGAISTLERSARRGPQQQTLDLLADALRLEPEQRKRFELAALAGRRRSVRGVVPAGSTAQNNLPNLLTSFRGRERELAELDRLAGERRLVTLLGTGGVGKTRLALESAQHQATTARFPDGIWLVELAPLGAAGLVASAIARVLGAPELPATPLVETLVATIAEKKMLVVLDNCEHVLAECAELAERLLGRCSGLAILATTREALRIDGECVVRVRPLPCDDDRASGPALDLLVDRLIDADFERFSSLTSDDRELVATICRRLDGVPLALELAAGRAGDVPLGEIVSKLDERFALLNEGRRTAAPRQHTLRGMIDWSYALLDAHERELFARLGLFAGSFSTEAACVIGDGDASTVRATLAALVAKSLVSAVEVHDASVRFRLLETMRVYALDRLHESKDADSGRRFAAYFAGVAKAADVRYGRMSNDNFLAMVEDDLDNFRAALAWAFGEGDDPKLGAELAGAMGWIYRQTALYVEGTGWAERALAVPELDPLVAGRLHMALGYFFFNVGGMARALDEAIAAEAYYRAANVLPELAWSLTTQAYALYRFSRIDEVRVVGAAAVGVARDAGDPLRLAGALTAFALGVPSENAAERFSALEEAIRCCHAAGDADAIVPTAHLAAVYYEAGNFAQALACGLDVAT